MTTSLSAADFNGDGLLDVYLCTYGHMTRHYLQLAKKFLSDAEYQELRGRLQGSHRYLNLAGPPNLLLVNRGNGKFHVADHNEQLEFWQASLQATWCDFDKDGDPDLYVANDFGPDHLMRNNGTDGFENVTQTCGHRSMQGFGMGATWGDYDLDGRHDLYVSNMYSKAGIRIIRRFPGVDRGIRGSADGNRLYQSSEDAFILLSGEGVPEFNCTARAGWSWGGQWVDLDHDGYLDLAVTSGYFTPPEEATAGNDL